MTRLLFWALDGALARREPEWRLLEGAPEALRALSAEGWRNLAVIEAPEDIGALQPLGLSGLVEPASAASLGAVIEAARPFDEGIVIGSSVPRDIMAAREAALASILVGDASPFAQFCVEAPGEIPLALATWGSMRKSFLLG
jgi:hypothetical protein